MTRLLTIAALLLALEATGEARAQNEADTAIDAGPVSTAPDATADQERGDSGTRINPRVIVVDEEDPNEVESQSRFEVYKSFQQHYEDGDLEGSLPLATRVVELTEEQYGAGDMELVSPLINLGKLYQRLGDFEASIDSYVRSVEIVENHEGIFSKRLITPLIGLGVTYNTAKEYPTALAAFNRARAVSRRADGLHNLGQIEILEGLSNSTMGLHDFITANDYQETSFRLSERMYGNADLRLVPAIYKLALWHRNTYGYTFERELYRRAMALIETHEGVHSPKLVTPLRGTAISLRQQGLLEMRGERGLIRALEIIDHSDDPDGKRIATLTDLGDWYMTFNKSEKGVAAYRQVWDELHAGEPDLERIARIFGQPVLIVAPNPSPLGTVAEDTDDEIAAGHVVVEFIVQTNGQTDAVTVAESEPAGRKDKTMLRAMRQARYRPRFEAGEAVATEAVTYRYDYHYRAEKNKQAKSEKRGDE